MKRGHPFGEKKKEKDLVRKELARVRTTAMEGSFGTQKEHYDLRRVKARTKRTEIDKNWNFEESETEIKGIGRCFA